MLRYFCILFFALFILSASSQEYEDIATDSLEQYLEECYEHFEKSEFVESVKIANKLLDASHKKDNKHFKAEAYYFLGLVDEITRSYDRAEVKYLKSLSIVKELKDTLFIVDIYNGLGSVTALKDKNFKKSEAYYLEGLDLAEKINSQYTATLTLNLCWNYLDQNKPEKVTPYVSRLQSYLKNPPDDGDEPLTRSSINHVLGRYYTHKNRFENAERLFKKSIALGKKHDLYEQLQYAYLYSSKAYAKNNNHQAAYKHLQEHLKYKEIFVNRDLTEKLRAEGIRFKLAEYERALETSKRGEELMASIAASRNKLIWVYTFVFVVLLILLIIIFKENRTKRKLIKFLNQNNEALKRANQKADAAAKIKSQFINSISHEIRTPLHGVVGITSLLLAEKEISDGNKQLLESLKFSGDYLLSLINNVLLISKIDNHKVKIRPKETDLKSFTDNITNSVQFSAEKNDCQVHVDLSRDIPSKVMIDSTILFEILINLIENAIKFTKSGKVILSIKLVQEKENKLVLQFAVTDNGAGIPKDKKEEIFNEFSQVNLDTSIMEGTGLGLSIVKKLLDLMDSEIQVESKLGKGTTFYFDLICAKIKDTPAHKKLVTNKKLLANARILLIEDNKINRMVIEKFLSAYQVNLDIKDEGKEGYQAITQNEYDLILLDINIPGMNGFEISQKVRETQNNVPIIAVTASELREIQEKADLAGIDDILIKPFSKEKLVAIIEKHLLK
ncbi:tetratricopeptide repeat-containing hybrid sensor histidine kinase/response regulator [Haloflavibacter putidus]|uniref:histidine kinase n=1 Tax=Haloflavibacter putidus TaxID=2576776 RepID=A0A507ZU98_9FLAO|nr:ATP-binding protein [Haloflavibacter putidus]TQD40171.1 response regulator [Haloflavibacter putidus]